MGSNTQLLYQINPLSLTREHKDVFDAMQNKSSEIIDCNESSARPLGFLFEKNESIGNIEITSEPVFPVILALAPESRHVSNNTALKLLSNLRTGNKGYFGWSEVSYSLASKNMYNQSKCILKGLSGMVVPGEVVAIIGASGSGKTSLLNVLSGRLFSRKGHVVNGKFTINGKHLRPEYLGAQIGYVSQEDILMQTSTPREALEFSARLRLPPSTTADERKAMVDEALKVLRLESCADSTIGNDCVKGISGGERR